MAEPVNLVTKADLRIRVSGQLVSTSPYVGGFVAPIRTLLSPADVTIQFGDSAGWLYGYGTSEGQVNLVLAEEFELAPSDVKRVYLNDTGGDSQLDTHADPIRFDRVMGIFFNVSAHAAGASEPGGPVTNDAYVQLGYDVADVEEWTKGPFADRVIIPIPSLYVQARRPGDRGWTVDQDSNQTFRFENVSASATIACQLVVIGRAAT